MFNLMALAFVSVIEWPRIPAFVPKKEVQTKKTSVTRLVEKLFNFIFVIL